MSTAKRSNQYFICSKEEPLIPIPWSLPDIDENTDLNCIYFGKVFEAMEESLEIQGLIFYLTWSVDKLPSYGQEVVAVILGDEWCRIPTYFNQVGAVFKCYGISPMLGCNPLIKPSYLNVLTLGQFLKNYILRLPSLLIYIFYCFRTLQFTGVKSLPIYDIPLGYFNQLDLPIKGVETRPYDIFFAGSVAFTAYPIWSIRHWLQTPKILARKQMLSNLYAIQQNYSKLKIEVAVTPGFGFQGPRDIAAKVYSENLMNTKICLVPRGSSFETFRFFEALRYGCIVISESLPSHWFYDGSPAIQIKSWNELGDVLKQLIESNSFEAIHQKSLSWWKTKCSETAVGDYMAKKINSIYSISAMKISTNQKFNLFNKEKIQKKL